MLFLILLYLKKKKNIKYYLIIRKLKKRKKNVYFFSFDTGFYAFILIHILKFLRKFCLFESKIFKNFQITKHHFRYDM